MLVYGGTFNSNNGNRALEDACNLKHSSQERLRLFEQQVKVSEDLFDLRDALHRLNSDDLNIVGSRGYVYSSKKLAALILCEGLRWEPNVLPRTSGLRAKFLELSGMVS